MINSFDILFGDDNCCSVRRLIWGLTPYRGSKTCDKLISILMKRKVKKVSYSWFANQVNNLIGEEESKYESKYSEWIWFNNVYRVFITTGITLWFIAWIVFIIIIAIKGVLK